MSQSNPLSYSIIIPVFNKWELTCDCLTSLREYTPGNSFEVIVVDNASSDATSELLPGLGKNLFGENFHYIRNAENRNFAGASNQGAQAARADIFFFLNNDTLLTPNWDGPLLKALENDHSLGAIGPMLVYKNDKVQHIGAAIYPDSGIGHFYIGIPAAHPLVLKRRSLKFITGAAFMVSKKNFFAAGAFCEEYINGFEDVELCLRLRQLGLTLTVEPDSKIYHLESQSRGRCDQDEHNALILQQRCPGPHLPDFHKIVLDDGYMPYLSCFLETFITLPQARLEKLEEETSGSTDIPLYLHILQREIFWEDGYKKLARLFSANGQPDSALDIMAVCCHFFHSLENLKELMARVRLSGKLHLINDIVKSIDGRIEMLNNKKIIKNSYEHIMSLAQAGDDEQLLRLIKNWRKRYGKELLAQRCNY